MAPRTGLLAHSGIGLLVAGRNVLNHKRQEVNSNLPALLSPTHHEPTLLPWRFSYCICHLDFPEILLLSNLGSEGIGQNVGLGSQEEHTGRDRRQRRAARGRYGRVVAYANTEINADILQATQPKSKLPTPQHQFSLLARSSMPYLARRPNQEKERRVCLATTQQPRPKTRCLRNRDHQRNQPESF